MQIRPYQREDAELLADIWLEATLLAHPFIPADYWRSNHSRMMHEYLPQSDNCVLVDEKGHPRGFISMLGRHIAALFVHPEAQGKGYGSALLHYMQKQHSELTLNVYSQNTDSVHFYEYNGFTTTSTCTDPATGAVQHCMRWIRP